jgi:hypothetical protein
VNSRVRTYFAKSSVCFRNVGLLVLALFLSGWALDAQEVVTLISFTNVWAYEQSGFEPDSQWRSASYDDQVWPRGPGLLGFEDVQGPYLVHAPLQTRLTVSPAVTSFYFRTTFEFAGNLSGLSLIASNLIDDGCVIYLNGEEVSRFRMPRNQNAATFAAAGPTAEGTLESVAITNLSLLRPGLNVIAAEVHQNASVSGDIMWGMRLVSIRPLPLTITRQPQSLLLEEGQTNQFSVEVSGGPVRYQWFRDGTALPLATNHTLKLGPVNAAHAGAYVVAVSNGVSFVLSQPAMLDVYEDRFGPKLLGAVVVGVQSVTNSIDLTFSEPLLTGAQTTDTDNFTLTRQATGETVPVTNASLVAATVRLRVDTSDADWILGEPCYVTVNNVRDIHTNVIAPNSRVAVAWPRTRLVQPADALWSFHAAAYFEPTILDEPWIQPSYREGPWWGTGRGGFKGGLVTSLPTCIGELNTDVGFQPEPILFRSSFEWPAELGNQAVLRFSTWAVSGLVLYLNGTEIWRYNVVPGPLDSSTRARSFTTGSCMTNTQVPVTNLVAGANWLAAAVLSYRETPTLAQVTFLLQMEAATTIPGPLPDNPLPLLQIAPATAESVRLSWGAPGYALESTTRLDTNMASAPLGPWREVPEMTNPYFYSLTNELGGMRFFRLKR